ncbi:ABC transporter [Kitasatospora cinereorecta]|uniref:ABC transporter n=1 Tax=Kitasatospora cinereorecta TaxID=285560 RepID=A0ABW0VI68_9ACTN
MRVLVRYHLELLVRSQRWLPPFLAYVLLMVIGLSGGEEALGAFGWSGAVLLPVTAWLVRCAVTAEPAASRACLTAAAGAVRVHLAALFAALLAGGALALAGLAVVGLVAGGSKADPASTALAGVLASAVCVLLGAAVGALFNRPVLLSAQYGIPLSLAAATLVLVTPGSPPNAVVRALITASRGRGLELPALLTALPVAMVVAGLALAAAALLAGRRQE